MHGIVLLLALATALPAHAGDALRPGQRVKARGHFDAGGFVAEHLRVRETAADDDVEIAGVVTGIDDETDHFEIGGIRIAPDEDELDRASRRLARAIDAGDFVKAEGHLDGDGKLVADTLERLRGDAAVPAVEGIVTAVEPLADGAQRLRIGALSVTLPASAVIEGVR